MSFDINYIKRNLLIGYPLFGSVISNLNFVSTDLVDTAATDGKVVLYNEAFLASLDKSEQMFVLAHEVCHVAFKHMYRKENKNIDVWNVATDAVINALLQNDGLKMPKNMIDIEEAINYDCEMMYELLLENAIYDCNEEMKVTNHDKWGDTTLEESMISESETFKENKEVRNTNFKKLKEDLTRTSLGISDNTKSDIRNTKNISRKKSLIDWRLLLNESINYEVDWSYEDAIIEDGVVVAQLVDRVVPISEILVDTSGSIDEELLRKFLSECKNILKVSVLKVGCFDTRFYGFSEIRSDEDIDNMTFIGGGGTDFEVAINSFSNRVDNKIIFTDGKGYIPPSKDIIWLIYNEQYKSNNDNRIIYVDDLSGRIINRR
jgi:predicted metal-dependent peptidase